MAPRKRKSIAPTLPESADLTAQAQAGIRQGANRVRDLVFGTTGISTLALLAVSSLLPFMTGPATVATVTTWLAGLGSNALAGWLASWADKAGARVVSVDTDEVLLKDLAADLDQYMATDQAFADSVAVLLDHIQAIPTILESRLEDQAIVLQALRADLWRNEQIQGRLYRLLYEHLEAQTTRLLAALADGMAARSAEAQAVLAIVEQIRSELRQATKPSITVTGSANIGTLQSGTGRATGVEIRALQGEHVDIRGEQVTVVQHQPPAPIDPVVAAQQLAALPLDTIPDLASVPPGSRMPLARNPLFVGREDDLKQLAATLKGGSTAAIGQIAAATGLGGIGKTNLATEFVHRYGQYFAGGVFWLSFADGAGVPAEVAACGVGLELPGFADLKLDDQVVLVRHLWQQPIPRLLIFDNCEDEALLGKWRPTSGGCRLLVTSRRARWSVVLSIEVLALGVLSRLESIVLLRKHRPDLSADNPDLAALAAELGDLPLALHVAGSYLARYRQAVTLAEYLTQLRSPSLLQHRSLRLAGMSPTGHDHDVGRTFALSYNQLDSSNPTDALALALLARAAYFAPGEPIPRDLLLATVELAGDDVALMAEDALVRLVELGLLERAEEGTLTLHRLLVVFVQAAAQDAEVQAAVEEGIYRVANRLNKAGLPAPLLALQGHLRFVTDRAMVRDDEWAARLCNELGYYLKMIGEYRAARAYYEQALAIRRKVLGEQHPDMAASLNNLGRLLQDVGDLSGARPYLEQALAIKRKVLGEQHPDTALSLNNLGMLLQDVGDLSGARPLYEDALAIRRKVLGDEHPSTATSLNNLGRLVKVQGDLSGARSLYEQALAIRQKVLGEEHPNTANSLNNLGDLLQDMGELSGARAYYEQALAIRRKVLGEEHPDTALSLNNLGMLLEDEGDLSGARPLYEQALAINKKVLEEQHPDTALSLNNLGGLLRAQGDLSAARLYLEQALAIRRKVLGEEHPDMAYSLNSLGLLLEDVGDLSGAQEYLEQALAIFERMLGPDHPNTQVVLHNLAGLDAPAQTPAQQIAQIRQQADAAVEAALVEGNAEARVALAEQLEARAQWAEEGEQSGSPYLDLAAHLRGLIVRLREGDADNVPSGVD